MTFIVRALEEPRDKVSFLGDWFLADGANASDRLLWIGMAVRATEDMAKSVGVSRVEGGLELFTLLENG